MLYGNLKKVGDVLWLTALVCPFHTPEKNTG